MKSQPKGGRWCGIASPYYLESTRVRDSKRAARGVRCWPRHRGTMGCGSRTLMKTVLIADDEPSLRLLVNATIMSDAYNIVEAADGNQAWALIQKHRPEVAVLDVRMPGKSGLEVTRAIKGDSSLAGTRVILLTANSFETDV